MRLSVRLWWPSLDFQVTSPPRRRWRSSGTATMNSMNSIIHIIHRLIRKGENDVFSSKRLWRVVVDCLENMEFGSYFFSHCQNLKISNGRFKLSYRRDVVKLFSINAMMTE